MSDKGTFWVVLVHNSCINYANMLTLGNVKLVSCLALCGKKCSAWYNHFIFVQKGISFLFYHIVMEMLSLWMNLSGKSLQITISLISQQKYCVFSIQICTYQNSVTVWQLLTVHNYIFKFSPFYFFRLNWIGCLFYCNTGTLRKQSLLYPDVL